MMGDMQKSVTDAYRVSVRDFLRIGGLDPSKLLAGHEGEDRGLTTLRIIETPDFIEHIQANAFVMTGGFPLNYLKAAEGAGARTLVDLIEELNRHQAAGLGIQFGDHVKNLPEEASRKANELGFPIVELPRGVPLDRLFGQAIVEISRIQADGFRRTEALLLSLERLLLEGADMQGIGDELAQALGVGILVTSNDGRVMADSLDESMHQDLTEWDLYDDTGRFRAEQVLVAHNGLNEAGTVLVQRIFAAEADLARLVAYDPAGNIGEDVRYSLQRARNVIALLITQQQAVNAVENKYRGDFLRDVLTGRSSSQEYSEEYALGLGWELAMPCIVVYAQIDPQDPQEEPASTELRRAWQSRFHLAWTQVVGRESRTFPVADFSDEVVAIIAEKDAEPGDPDASLRGLQELTERFVRHVSGDRGGGRRPFSVGTSRLVTSFKELPAAYQQARRAAEVGRRFTGGGNTSHFDNLGIHRLIGLIPDRQEMTAFAHDVLGELADDTEASADLRNTLQVLIDNNLNVAEASRELFMHYNTMRYRIAKLEKMLGPFTTDPHLRLNVAVALQVHRIES